MEICLENLPQIIEEHEGLVRTLANKFSNMDRVGIMFDDRVSYGKEEIWRCVKKFNKNKHVKFSTYLYSSLYRCFSYYYRRAIKTEGNKIHSTMIKVSLSNNDLSTNNVSKNAHAGDSLIQKDLELLSVKNVEDKTTFKTSLNSLQLIGKDKQIIDLLIAGFRISEICNSLQINRKKVKDVAYNTLEKLNKGEENMDINKLFYYKGKHIIRIIKADSIEVKFVLIKSGSNISKSITFDNKGSVHTVPFETGNFVELTDTEAKEYANTKVKVQKTKAEETSDYINIKRYKKNRGGNMSEEKKVVSEDKPKAEKAKTSKINEVLRDKIVALGLSEISKTSYSRFTVKDSKGDDKCVCVIEKSRTRLQDIPEIAASGICTDMMQKTLKWSVKVTDENIDKVVDLISKIKDAFSK